MSDSSGSGKGKSGDSQHTLTPLSSISGHGGGHSANAEDHGEGNWLVSYADMMTLLVGFFVILLSFSSVEPEKFEEARRSITEEFGGAYQVPYAELADRVREIVKKLGIGDQLIIKQSDLGLEISFRGTVFFDTGSSELKSEARPVLENLVVALNAEAGVFDVTVEGHTDDVPISKSAASGFRNNWELSSLRACRVLEAFLTAGLPKDRLTAVGYGEARPLVPNRDANGQGIVENQAQNRRVVIKLFKHADSVIPAKSAQLNPPATESVAQGQAEHPSEHQARQ